MHFTKFIPSSSYSPCAPSTPVAGIQGQPLEITVAGCYKLRDTEWNSRQDPYVCLEYASTKSRTRTCTDGGTDPTFQEKFVLTLIEGLREFSVVVWSSNTVTVDELIGSGRIQLQRVLSEGYDDTAWPLQDKKGRHAGEVRLIMHYVNAKKPEKADAPSAPSYPSAPAVPPYSAPSYPPASYPPASYPPVSYPPASYLPASYPPPAPQYPSYPPNLSGYPPQQYPVAVVYLPTYPPTSSYPPHPHSAYPPPPPNPQYHPPGFYHPPPYPPQLFCGIRY